MSHYKIDSLFSSWVESGRLPHSMLVHGEDIHTLSICVQGLAKQLLGDGFKEVTHHPDYFAVRPSNKMRRISVDSVRGLIQKVYKSANQAERKVVVIYEADRMHTSAANAFLKTLEEPPLDTTIFLLTAYPNRLMPTIRSRCFSLHVPCEAVGVEDEDWKEWLGDYESWINGLVSSDSIDRCVMGVYGLVVRFDSILKKISKGKWKIYKGELTAPMQTDEEIALEVSFYKELRGQLFREIGARTRSGIDVSQHALSFSKVIEKLERSVGLLEVNLNEMAALEYFLLESLRIWYQVTGVRDKKE